MSILLTAILAISATANDATQETVPPAANAAQPAVARSGRELSDAAHAAMRHWAKATDKDAEAAARELLDIYHEIQQDTGMARSQRETLRLTVRARLDQLCTQIIKQLAKDKAAAKDKPKENDNAATKPSNVVKSVAATKAPQPSAVLAQNGAAVGGAGAGGQNANADNGQALVDLIQTTISPKSWDINGGACTIYYWQQQHAIVVRATGDVHDDISDALEQLNRAGH